MKIDKDPELLILNLPDPPQKKVTRDYAGGYGVSVYKPKLHKKDSMKPLLNLFLPYSASVAKEFFINYKIIDAQAEKYSKDKTIKTINKENPDILYTMISLPSYNNDVDILKEINKNIIKIGCGEISKIFSQDILSKNILNYISLDNFPYVKSLQSLLNNMNNKNNVNEISGFINLKYNSYKNMHYLNYKDYNEFKMVFENIFLKKYEHTVIDGEKILTIPILGSRGCEYSCMYCPYPYGFGRKMVYMKPELVIEEIQRLRSLGVKGILFRNQSFNSNTKWSKSVCEALINNKIDVLWLSESRVDEVNLNILSLMEKSGCRRLHFGVETGDYSLINIAKPGVNLDNTINAFKISRKLGIWRQAHLLIGLPGETLNTLKNTREFVREIRPDGVSINFATPYPGTQLYNYAKKNNLILTYDWDRYTSHNIVMEPKNVDKFNILKYSKQIKEDIININYLENKKSIKNILEYYLNIYMTKYDYKKKQNKLLNLK